MCGGKNPSVCRFIEQESNVERVGGLPTGRLLSSKYKSGTVTATQRLLEISIIPASFQGHVQHTENVKRQ
jgi:hypothetical protein